jgi:hypothetical protein
MKPTSAEAHTQSKLATWASRFLVVIFVLMPFHALLTTWGASNFGHLDLFKVWKDLLMLPLAVYAGVALWRDRRLAHRLAGSWVIRLILVYGLFFLGFGLLAHARHSTNTTALLYSWVTNLQMMAIFVLAWVIVAGDKLILRNWARIILAPATIVVIFGLLQRTVLPPDFLSHFGYGPKTIPAVETVDQKLAFRRIQSTLRGANPLGTYLIMVISSILVLINRRRRLFIGLLGGALVVLFFSYSRSAWLGAGAAAVCLAWYRLPKAGKSKMLLLVTCLVLLSTGLTWQLRHNDFVQNTLFHSDETSQAKVSSNAAHSSALENGMRDVWRQPFGRGPGTAGPASVRNDHPARIAENYYIQLAQEVGLLGLGLFLAINGLVAWHLWHRWSQPLAKVLLLSLIGISVVNMLSHAWTDDTIAVLWWGLAGAAMNLPIATKKTAIMNKEQTRWPKKDTSKKPAAAN